MKSKCTFILKALTAMVLVVMMLFGTVATTLAATVEKTDTAAKADLASTGGWPTPSESTFYVNNSITSKWGNNSQCPTASSSGNTLYYDFYVKSTDSDFEMAFYCANWGNDGRIIPQDGTTGKVLGTSSVECKQGYSGTTASWKVKPSTMAESGYNYTKIRVNCDVSGYNWNGAQWYAATGITNLSPTLDVPSTGTVGTAITLTGGSTDTGKIGSLTKTYQYSTDNGSTWTDLESGSYTASSTGTVKFRYKVSDNGVNTSGTTVNGRTERVEYSSEESCTFSNPTTPNIDTFTINGGSSASINIGATATLASTKSNSTDNVSYSSSNTSVATVSGSGNSATVTAVAPGTATITASLSGATSKTVTVTVNTPTITVANKTGLKIGETYTPSPTLKNPSATGSGWTVVYSRSSGTYSTTNGTTITGDTYNSGATTFKASYQYNSVEKASTTFTVKTTDPTITFNSTAQTVNIGATVTKTATGGNIGSGATGTITYSSGDTSIATVSSDGVVTGVKPGTTSITATYTVKIGSTVKATKTASYNVTVNTPSITQGNVTIAKGNSKTLSTATTNPSSGLTVTFALSGSPNGVTCTSAGVVTVAQNSTASSATVVATAKNSGGTTVATKNITVTIANPSLSVKDGSTSVADGTVYTTKGTNKTLTVDTNFSDTLYVKSSNTSIATVSLSGTTLTITPKAKGTCKVSVSTSNSVAPAAAALAETAAAMPNGLMKRFFEAAATAAVATQTVQFTVNVAEADTNKFITYATSSWTGTVYAWYSDAWHTMTKVGTDDGSRTVWALNVGSSYPSTVVFSSQNSWNDGGNGLNQTVDCSVSASANSFYENGQSGGKRNVGSYATTITIPQLVASDVSVKIDQTGSITTTVVNNTTPAKTTYTSNSTSIATVSTAGVVTGKSVGNTIVTVRAWAAKPYSSWTQWITDSTTQALLSGTATSNITVTADPQTITNSQSPIPNPQNYIFFNKLFYLKYL